MQEVPGGDDLGEAAANVRGGLTSRTGCSAACSTLRRCRPVSQPPEAPRDRTPYPSRPATPIRAMSPAACDTGGDWPPGGKQLTQQHRLKETQSSEAAASGQVPVTIRKIVTAMSQRRHGWSRSGEGEHVACPRLTQRAAGCPGSALRGSRRRSPEGARAREAHRRSRAPRPRRPGRRSRRPFGPRRSRSRTRGLAVTLGQLVDSGSARYQAFRQSSDVRCDPA